MSKTLQQIFAANPITSNISTDLMYFVQSPYTPGTDAGMTFANFAAQFGLSGGVINPAHGGTGINNGTNTITLGGNILTAGALTTTGAFGATFNFTAGTNVTFPTSGTLATTTNLNSYLPLAGGTMAGAINMGTFGITNLANGVNPQDAATVSQLTAASSPLTTKGDLYTFSTVNARLPVATGDGKFLQVLASAATGLAWSTATLPAVATGTGTLLRADGTNWVATTSTYPNTNAINTLLYASAANVMSALATANSGTLITSASGVPSISQTLPTAVQGNITQLGSQSQALNMNSYQINSVSDPTSAQDAATKNYVDTMATGGAALCVCATTANLNATQLGAGVGATLTNAGAQAAFSVDGVSPVLGARVLVKNQTASQNNGIYNLTVVGTGATNWVLTRATDYNTPTEINDTGVIPVQSGTVNANTGWVNTTINVAVDTTAITYVQFGASYPLSLANGGTNAALTASNGGIVWSNASQLQILAGTATANQILLSGATATPAWSTTTYPATNAINTIMYASSANVLGVIAAVNGGVLVSNNSGVPSMLANPAAAGKMLQSANAAIPTWSTPTFPSGSGAAGAVLISDGTNYLASTSLWPNTVGTSGKVVISNGTANVYSTPTFPNASATAALFIVSDGTNWVASAKAAFTTVNIQVFVASGTYTPTTGMKYCITEAVGQGGGGGGVASSTGAGSGGGGGAGSYSRKFSTAATIGASQTVTIANTGGTGGIAGNNAGTNGSDASLGVICVGKGGTGGGGAGANGAGLGGAGGVAGTGDVTAVGNGGGAGMGGSISTLAVITGRGAASVFGGSPAQKLGNASATGAAATNYGSGGDGGCSFTGGAAAAGGAGSGGIVIVTEYIYA